MKNIKNIVRENLDLRYRLSESMNKISTIEDEDKRFFESMEIIGNLIEEGHDQETIEMIVSEQNWFTNLLGLDKKQSNNLNKSVETAGKGGVSQFKEFLIQKLLGMLGFRGPFINALSTALVDIEISDLVSMFRGKSNCEQVSGKLALAFGEGMARYMIENVTEGEETFAAGFFRNITTEFMRKQGYDKKIAPVICNFIKNKVPNFLK